MSEVPEDWIVIAVSSPEDGETNLGIFRHNQFKGKYGEDLSVSVNDLLVHGGDRRCIESNSEAIFGLKAESVKRTSRGEEIIMSVSFENEQGRGQ